MVLRYQLVRVMKKFFYAKKDIDDLLVDKETIHINKEQVDNFPSSLPPASHGHGNLQSNGQVGSTAQASKNVVTDSSGKITTENKPTIPTKTSQLTNDSGFLTTHQNISGKEDTANKISSWNDTPNNTNYPSEKLVKDTINTLQTAVNGKASGTHKHPLSDLTITDTGYGNTIDFNEYKTPGFFKVWSGSHNHAPDTHGGLLTVLTNVNGVIQYVINYYDASPKIYYRVFYGGSTNQWRDWKEISTSGHSHSISDISNFNSHTHNAAQVTSQNAYQYIGTSSGDTQEVINQSINGKFMALDEAFFGTPVTYKQFDNTNISSSVLKGNSMFIFFDLGDIVFVEYSIKGATNSDTNELLVTNYLDAKYRPYYGSKYFDLSPHRDNCTSIRVEITERGHIGVTPLEAKQIASYGSFFYFKHIDSYGG